MIARKQPVCYSETETRIIRAFFAYVTLEVGVENDHAALVFRLRHPEHNLADSIPMGFSGKISSANSALEKFARRIL